jgi:hypothetical protein
VQFDRDCIAWPNRSRLGYSGGSSNQSGLDAPLYDAASAPDTNQSTNVSLDNNA